MSSSRSSGHYQSFFLISDFLAERRKANKNKRKRSLILQYIFARKTSLILRTSNHLTLKIICSCFWLYRFFSNIFLFGVRKNICTAQFLGAQELHSWSTLNANFCIFLYMFVRKLLSQRCSKIWTSSVRLWLNFLQKKSLSLSKNIIR